MNFLNKVMTKSRPIQVLLLPVELNDLLGILFLFSFSALLEERMFHALVDGETEIGIEYEDLMQQVDGLLTSTWINCG